MQAEMVSVFLVDFASTLHRNNLQPQHSESGAPEGDAVLTKSIPGLRINVASRTGSKGYTSDLRLCKGADETLYIAHLCDGDL